MSTNDGLHDESGGTPVPGGMRTRATQEEHREYDDGDWSPVSLTWALALELSFRELLGGRLVEDRGTPGGGWN